MKKIAMVIITTLIVLKIIGAASIAKADNINFTCSDEAKIQLIDSFNNPLHRCGNLLEIIKI